MSSKEASTYSSSGKVTPPTPTRNLLRHRNQRRTSQADVSYLLDPSYSGASGSNTPPSVYCDQLGQLHDPDFRLFPELPLKRRRTSQVGWRTVQEEEEEREREERILEEIDAYRSKRTMGGSRLRRQYSRSSMFPSLPSAPPSSRRRTHTVPVPDPLPSIAHYRTSAPNSHTTTLNSYSPSSYRSNFDTRSILSDDDEEPETTSRTRCRMPWSPSSATSKEKELHDSLDYVYVSSCLHSSSA